MNSSLTAPITREETKAAMESLGELKAPGPDGLNGLFYRKHWDIIAFSFSFNSKSCLSFIFVLSSPSAPPISLQLSLSPWSEPKDNEGGGQEEIHRERRLYSTGQEKTAFHDSGAAAAKQATTQGDGANGVHSRLGRRTTVAARRSPASGRQREGELDGGGLATMAMAAHGDWDRVARRAARQLRWECGMQ
ncbi:hypothetical protein SESBI_47928 [Sesbania bispinosa]|nr:hypothetical protein SESBI_47928 [Sesbania bispinosa]